MEHLDVQPVMELPILVKTAIQSVHQEENVCVIVIIMTVMVRVLMEPVKQVSLHAYMFVFVTLNKKGERDNHENYCWQTYKLLKIYF